MLWLRPLERDWSTTNSEQKQPGPPTGRGQILVGLVAEDLREAGLLRVHRLLHGLHAHAQVLVLRLQHGVLVHQVVDALRAVLAQRSLPLRARRSQTGHCITVCITVWYSIGSTIS